MRGSPAIALPLVAVVATCGCRAAVRSESGVRPLDDPRLAIGELLHADDFDGGLGQWRLELERPGRVVAEAGTLDVDVPAGATLWFLPELNGPVMIAYEAAAIDAGGPNDRVSDLNCFWMARDARDPDDLFAVARAGRFAEYDELFTYYASLGGNGNTTTRFRRYVGSAATRPLLPAHDRRGPADLLVPNRSYRIRLVAAGGIVQFYRDGRRVFSLEDARPYTNGRFAIRTVHSHLAIRRLRIYRLKLT